MLQAEDVESWRSFIQALSSGNGIFHEASFGKDRNSKHQTQSFAELDVTIRMLMLSMTFKQFDIVPEVWGFMLLFIGLKINLICYFVGLKFSMQNGFRIGFQNASLVWNHWDVYPNQLQPLWFIWFTCLGFL